MSINDIYTQFILEESRNSKNRKTLEHFTHEELGHNPSCGDEITLQMDLENDKIQDLAYSGVGCAISQASTSVMIDTVKKLPRDKAIKLCDLFIGMIKGEELSEEQEELLGDALVFESVKNLPARVKCAVLPWYTLKSILENSKKD
ncbi:SUF system NifU family Fe-S cluster assembly protein [Peptoniphilus sp. GNH]|nr:SUF system FeS assembly protein, NifU family [Clostridiales bacterium KA00134]UHR03144.1 SUF system NifU family Fe-S cluster assembly protein [Peptoniphilus sp. GNH]